MRNFYKLLAILFLSGSALAAPKVGKMAPDFSLKGHDGKTYKLSSLKGQFVVLEWFNNDCPYVEKHYHEKARNMQTLQMKWAEKAKKAGKKLTWLSVVSSAPGKQGYLKAKEAKQIRDQRKAHMTAILMDPSGKVGKAYEAKTTPHMFLIDEKGILRYDGAIDNKPSARLSSLDGASNYVATGLDSMMLGKTPAVSKTKPYGCSVKY